MLNTFNEKLLSVLNEEEQSSDGSPITSLKNASQELKETEAKLEQLKSTYAHALQQTVGHLAIAIKKSQPRLDTTLKNGECVVGFKSKTLTFHPDLDTNTWVVGGNDPSFARRFMRNYAAATALGQDMDLMVKAISQFFTNHYRSL